MAIVEYRVTILETEFRTELQHLATKTVLANLKADLRGDMRNLASGVAGLQLIGLGAVATVFKLLG